MGEYNDNISISRIVELAKYEVGEESNSAFDFIFEQWAGQAAVSMDNKQTYAIKAHEGDVECGRVKKPCGYIKHISSFIENTEYVYVNSDWYCANKCEIPRNAIRNTVTEIDGYLDFGNRYDGKCMLIYESLNVNADGVLLADIKDDKTPEQYLHQYC